MADRWHGAPTELLPEERDRLIEKIATAITARGMETPAILFLEMHKPLAFIGGQSLLISSPFTAPFIGMENVQTAAKLIESRDNVERLIQRIEDLAIERREAKKREKNAARG